MTGAIHPWRRFRHLAHIKLMRHDGGPAGVTNFVAGTISLRRDLTQAERRTTILHECLHVERGPALSTLAAREELRVERETARLLMPDVRAIGEALAWATSLEEAADELWVDTQSLRVRLRYLHPAERGWLRRRLEDHEE
ncbi:hypothetical protein [Microcystis phage MinS1]|nr:hypothetical protein [Microcystis phage MinS1]